MTADVIDLAAIRAARSRRAEERSANFTHCIEIAQPVAKALNFGSYTAPPPAAPAASEGPTLPPTPARPAAAAPRREALIWRQSQRGNWWTKDAGSGTHVVLYETSRGWSGRATPLGSEGFYLNSLQADTLVAAQGAVEMWLREQEEEAAARR
jgi:hypothetical protein